jgi:hypothetical protein
MVVTPQAETSPISAFSKPRITNLHLFKPHHHGHTIHENPILGLLDALNLPMPSVLP